MVIRPPPIWVQLWNSSPGRRVKVNREDLSKHFDMQRPKGDSETLQEMTGMLSICLIDLP
jgi:hypothetical protein